MNGPLPPPAGPLIEYPQVDEQTAVRMIVCALEGLVMGPWDVEVRQWLITKEPAVVVTVASWLRRAWHAGLAAGLTEPRS